MTTYQDLKDFFKRRDFKVIMAADAETRTLAEKNGKIVSKIPAGGVSVALDPIAKAAGATYISRGKTDEEKKLLAGKNKMTIEDQAGTYVLKRLFLSPAEFEVYYNGFSNQTLWPLCHVAFENPHFHNSWYEGYKKVNEKFARSIREEIKGKTFVWIHDYQLALVPLFLGRSKDTTVNMFWHIPWPTWEVFRLLPQKKEILESLLSCDFLAFHRGYHVRNFLDTVERELEVRVDEETNSVYYNKHVTTVKNLPLGIDTDVIESLVVRGEEKTVLFENNKVILGVDRLDYTKGLRLRMAAIDRFLEKNPRYIGNVTYVGILAPSREEIPAYKQLKKDIKELANSINKKYGKKGWRPIHMINEIFSRSEIINFYRKADLCLVTPLDDGMNLVSKEFVIASSTSSRPGMLVLSQFAGSAIDLTKAIIVNPYNTEEVANAIKLGLEMGTAEKKKRIKEMAETLEERNVYAWAEDFVRSAASSAK